MNEKNNTETDSEFAKVTQEHARECWSCSLATGWLCDMGQLIEIHSEELMGK